MQLDSDPKKIVLLGFGVLHLAQQKKREGAGIPGDIRARIGADRRIVRASPRRAPPPQIRAAVVDPRRAPQGEGRGAAGPA